MKFDANDPNTRTLFGRTNAELTRAGLNAQEVQELRTLQQNTPPDHLTADELQRVQEEQAVTLAGPLADAVQAVRGTTTTKSTSRKADEGK